MHTPKASLPSTTFHKTKTFSRLIATQFARLFKMDVEKNGGATERQTGVVDLSTYQNNHYDPGKNLAVRMAWGIVNVLFFRNPTFTFYQPKSWLLRMFGCTVGERVVIKPCVNIKYPWHLTIGDNSWIGENVWIDNLTSVKIGNHVCISQGAMLLTGNHNYKTKSFDLIIGSIQIKDGAWVGAKSTVGPGVVCDSHSVLAVGSVATDNLQAYKIYQGNPAVAVREREIT